MKRPAKKRRKSVDQILHERAVALANRVREDDRRLTDLAKQRAQNTAQENSRQAKSCAKDRTTGSPEGLVSAANSGSLLARQRRSCSAVARSRSSGQTIAFGSITRDTRWI